MDTTLFADALNVNFIMTQNTDKISVPINTCVNQRQLTPMDANFHSNFDRILIDDIDNIQKLTGDPDSFWIPQGKSVAIERYSISGGFIYFGSGLKSVDGKSTEPSLIDISLEINSARPDHRGKHLSSNYYSSITPACRAAYLKWLSTGRKDPYVHIGYVFLFLFGLERRILADTRDSELARSEVPAIFSEVERLLSIYGNKVTFHEHAVKFLDFIFKIALGQMSKDCICLPDEWALACGINGLLIPQKMSVQLCPKEFRELFGIRYREEYADGLKLKLSKDGMLATYKPASPSFGGLVNLPDQYFPDLSEVDDPSSQLVEIVATCADELENYSRYLAKNPHDRNSIEALSHLPKPLLGRKMGEVIHNLTNRTKEQIYSDDMVLLPFSSLLQQIPPINQPIFDFKPMFVSISKLLAGLNVGIEPDPWFSFIIPTIEQDVVLFRLGEKASRLPTMEYFTTVEALDLIAVIAVSGSFAGSPAQIFFEENLFPWLSLDTNICKRLRARAKLIYSLFCGVNDFSNRIKLLNNAECIRLSLLGSDNVKKLLKSLQQDQIELLEIFLIKTIQTGGHIEASEVKNLTDIFNMLGLNTQRMFNDVGITNEPITIQTANSGRKRGFAIPSPPKPVEKFTLDMDSIEAKIAETKVVSSILNNIFSEAEQSSAIKSLTDLPTPPDLFIGLDAEAFTFMRILATKLVWEREELETLAAEHNLMLDGTLDSINDASYGHFGSPFFEGDGRIEIDPGIVDRLGI
ncbi:MAG: hypothetical protein HIU83_03805 [Proteobacteria bacterium]|nr:hypothetical protein [Pseudomonadota bacterium]